MGCPATWLPRASAARIAPRCASVPRSALSPDSVSRVPRMIASPAPIRRQPNGSSAQRSLASVLRSAGGPFPSPTVNERPYTRRPATSSEDALAIAVKSRSRRRRPFCHRLCVSSRRAGAPAARSRSRSISRDIGYLLEAVVVSRLAPEPRDRQVSQALHGSLGASHEVRRLGDGKPEIVAEHKRHPLAARERCHQAPHLHRVVLVRVRTLARPESSLSSPLQCLAPEVGIGEVDRDSVYPRRGIVEPVHAAPIAAYANEGLLRDLFRDPTVAAVDGHGADQTRVHASAERIERRRWRGTLHVHSTNTRMEGPIGSRRGPSATQRMAGPRRVRRACLLFQARASPSPAGFRGIRLEFL